MADARGWAGDEAVLGQAVEKVRRRTYLTQADVAVLLRGQGLGWRREQVVRAEAGQRQLTGHELYVLALVLRVNLGMFYELAGYMHATDVAGPYNVGWQPLPDWRDVDPADLSPAGRAWLRGDTKAAMTVDLRWQDWRAAETEAGRPPTERAERAKRASLWREYEEGQQQ